MCVIGKGVVRGLEFFAIRKTPLTIIIGEHRETQSFKRPPESGCYQKTLLKTKISLF